MSKTTKKLLFYLPRVLGILFALFISIFAADVFNAGYSFAETIVALLIHLLPTLIILIAVAIAWRWEWIGAILFFALGVWYIIMAWGRMTGSVYLIISGPLFLIGALFLLNWYFRDDLRDISSWRKS
ncbi:MAG: hypothetical protein GXP38_03085 [Chloroflexi bacterium]|nr:hypothetical protein [Chloroflexota bacterium]